MQNPCGERIAFYSNFNKSCYQVIVKKDKPLRSQLLYPVRVVLMNKLNQWPVIYIPITTVYSNNEEVWVVSFIMVNIHPSCSIFTNWLRRLRNVTVGYLTTNEKKTSYFDAMFTMLKRWIQLQEIGNFRYQKFLWKSSVI